MTDQRFVTQRPITDTFDGIELDRARPAAGRPASECSYNRILDPGDSHDKGEPGLCVGEAA
jgi:hypothetical protein